MTPVEFRISTGQLRIAGVLVGLGYSGHGQAANDVSRVMRKNVGPLPPGTYRIREWTPAEVLNGHKGPIVFQLTQLTGDAYDRAAFLIHWDNSLLNFTGSDGCIVFWFMQVFLAIRAAVTAGGNVLTVIA